MKEKTYNIWQNYQLKIKNDFIDDIKNFYPINYNKGKQGGFKTIKRHQSTCVEQEEDDEILENDDQTCNEFLLR